MAQNVFPTKNNLINTKKSLRLARVGYDLMDKKRNILVREIMQMMDDAVLAHHADKAEATRKAKAGAQAKGPKKPAG